MDFLKNMYELSKARAEALPSSLLEGVSGDFIIRPLGNALKKESISIIAEVKYATPAEGDLGLTANPADLAIKYEASGASAISCLTEPEYFKGELDYIRRIRVVCSIPVMMKDFITDKRQIMAGRNMGADAFLLITEMLTIDELRELYTFGKKLGMDALVEIHGEEGLEKALAVKAQIIGVNCRNLSTLKVDKKTHGRMVTLIPETCIRVAESGINNSARLKELKSIGYDAALVGRAMANSDSLKDVFSCG
jgi:indole-3-glycerol phosphate synthase